MNVTDAESLEKQILSLLHPPAIPRTAKEVEEELAKSLSTSIDENVLRESIWRLLDLNKIEFTKDWRLKRVENQMHAPHTAAPLPA